MNKFRKLLKSFKRIALIDRCLILFMIILMIQLIYNLFSNEVISKNTHNIDVVIRTTAASIFGYFLSANFIKKSKNNKISCFKDDIISNENSIYLDNTNSLNSVDSSENNPDFISSNVQSNNNTKNEIDIKNSSNKNLTEQETSKQQIIIATIIGVISLIVIIIARNFTDLTQISLASLTQMRDFVSGCIGFLLGTPSRKE
ncbi:hypothetical protein [Clostridium weizhouense]|uniref:Uncharacterized protein n=1 Tax=Clostridium weizhouense TaxID=2859781 RepID=A0ABS7ALP8_9CLOT|nr:hypothetical protein [Clostridium weizhouense]MBW6409489.1 hypothetical protein [Clostridium weizhouense]